MRITGLHTGAALLLVSACSTQPISVDQAMAQCTTRARAAAGPSGSVGIGGGSGGARSKLDIGITSDFLMGRAPADVYTNCVIAKSGRAPTAPLSL